MAANTTCNDALEKVRRDLLVKDQYAEMALLYDDVVGSLDQRTPEYKQFFADILRKNGCVSILDTACGTGTDSTTLLEQGFKLISTDGSDRMLGIARRVKLRNSGDPRYMDWIIEKANWKTLTDDIRHLIPDNLFDAVICVGNSFAHVFDPREQKECLANFVKCLKPGGLLLLDHRNYDAMIDGQQTPKYNAYFDYKHEMDVKLEVQCIDDKPELVRLDVKPKSNCKGDYKHYSEFLLYFYPHRLSSLTQMLDEVFDHRAEHQIFGDFKPLGEVPVPGYYIHVIRKPDN